MKSYRKSLERENIIASESAWECVYLQIAVNEVNRKYKSQEARNAKLIKLLAEMFKGGKDV